MEAHARWSLRTLDGLAAASTAIGAALALALMLYVGKGNDSRLLLALFSLWILVPFAMLLSAWTRSRAWPTAVRTALHLVMVGIPVITVGVYASVAFGPGAARHAAMFVLVPPLTSLLIVASLSIALLISRVKTPGRRSDQGNSPTI